MADVQTPGFVQPEIDINAQICTYNGISAIAGLAMPGCSIPGRAVWDMDVYPPIPPSPLSLKTDSGALISTDTGIVIVSDI
jgi:hypothetical protein